VTFSCIQRFLDHKNEGALRKYKHISCINIENVFTFAFSKNENAVVIYDWYLGGFWLEFQLRTWLILSRQILEH